MTSLAVIMQRRRLEEPHDWQPIRNPDIIAKLMNSLRRAWLSQNLTSEQQQKEDKDKASIFNAYLRRIYGGKKCERHLANGHFVDAAIRCSTAWMGVEHF